MKNYRSIYISLSLFILIIFGFFIGVLFGPTNLSLSDLNDAIFTKGSSPQSIIVWDNQVFMRISIQAYNTKDDVYEMFKMLKYFNLF